MAEMDTPADVPPQGSIYPAFTPGYTAAEFDQPEPPAAEPEPASLLSEPGVSASSVTGRLDAAEMSLLLARTGWPEEWRDDAMAIAWCESKWDPGARGDSGRSLGLFQLWTGWAAAYGVGDEDLMDPEINARIALHVREVRGRFGGGGGWTCADILGIP